MIDLWLSEIATLIDSKIWLAPLLALLAGVLTSVTPCCLSAVPLIIGYVSGIGEKTTKKAFLYSVVFAMGTGCMFVILGLIASSLGTVVGGHSHFLHIILGALMILMALQVYGVYNFMPSFNLVKKNKRRGYIGAFLTGVLAGIFSTPCSTPVIVALLAYVADKGNMLFGIILMILYSIGHSTIVVIAGTSIGFVKKLNESNFNKWGKILNIVLGTLILLIGVYMLLEVFHGE